SEACRRDFPVTRAAPWPKRDPRCNESGTVTSICCRPQTIGSTGRCCWRSFAERRRGQWCWRMQYMLVDEAGGPRSADRQTTCRGGGGMTPTLTPPPEAVAAPVAEERCDRCSAAGKLRIVLAGGGELVFCGHHANKF